MTAYEEENDIVEDLSSPDVTTKYMTASGIANKAIQAVVDAIKAGACVHDLCQIGDKVINDECSKIYNKPDKHGFLVEKGVAFPTSVSPNDISGHFSPLKPDSINLKDGDIVKIDLGCHIDGYIAMVAHTVVVGTGKVTGKVADAIHACHNAMEGALRKLKVGNSNLDVTAVVDSIAKKFQTQPLHGVLSHELKRAELETNNVIAHRLSPEERVQLFQFEPNQVYCIDMVMTAGDGRCKESDIKTTIYRRASDNDHLLKTQNAKKFMAEARRMSPDLPFSLRAFEDGTGARVGVSEAKKHGLLNEYPVIKEKDGKQIVQFKCTVLLLPSGTKKITGLAFSQSEQFVTDKKLEGELATLVTSSMNPKKLKKKAAAAAQEVPKVAGK
jgi:curved DNA binding protein